MCLCGWVKIIIVDDGSTDDTVKIANEYVSKYGVEVLRVLKLGTNQGKGAAVRKVHIGYEDAHHKLCFLARKHVCVPTAGSLSQKFHTDFFCIMRCVKGGEINFFRVQRT